MSLLVHDPAANHICEPELIQEKEHADERVHKIGPLPLTGRCASAIKAPKQQHGLVPKQFIESICLGLDRALCVSNVLVGKDDESQNYNVWKPNQKDSVAGDFSRSLFQM